MAAEGQLVESMQVKNFACLRDVEVRLTPLHAFIGPNDSGKSTLLRALRTALHLATSVFVQQRLHTSGPFIGSPILPVPEIQPFDPGLGSGASIALSFGDVGAYDIHVEESGRIREFYSWLRGAVRAAAPRAWVGEDARMGTPGPFASATPQFHSFIARVQAGARLMHLLPNALREPGGLIPEDGRREFSDEYGTGLPGILDAVLNRGDDSFLQIVDGVQRLFPTVRRIRLRAISHDTKAIEFELASGTRVPAKFASEGLLFYLAFAALQFLQPVGMLLVEEPENGLHPARIADIMRILREISQTTQVVLATHSPLVINEMQGDEVTLVTRDPEKGTQVRRLSETPNFVERSKVYALGELWLSYANGVDEAPLLADGKTT